jgi:ferric-dicitrate binding protein FerR (iron transport regulator)
MSISLPDYSHDLIALLADESFQRWLSGKASDEERKRWKEWLGAAPHHPELYAEAQHLWEKSHFQAAAPPNVERELQKLLARLHEPASTGASIRRLPSAMRVVENRSLWMRVGAVAAAAALLISLLWRFPPWQAGNDAQQLLVASTGYAERTRLTLPDCTVIILNAHSTLRYPAVWNAETPRGFELRGEAYFEVASRPLGPQHDFVVHTSDGDVKVVGTRFAVHERGAGTRVAVEEGRVQVTAADTSGRNPASPLSILLNPNQVVHFSKGSRALDAQATKVSAFTSWWRDYFVLEDTPFKEIVNRLEETYGVQVEVKDQGLMLRTLSGSMENRSLDVITRALAKALRTTVQRRGQIVVFGA